MCVHTHTYTQFIYFFFFACLLAFSSYFFIRFARLTSFTSTQIHSNKTTATSICLFLYTHTYSVVFVCVCVRACEHTPNAICVQTTLLSDRALYVYLTSVHTRFHSYSIRMRLLDQLFVVVVVRVYNKLRETQRIHTSAAASSTVCECVRLHLIHVFRLHRQNVCVCECAFVG